MTRINLVPPAELYDQHLFAEFREIKMIPKSLSRSLAAGRARGVTDPVEWVLGRIPKAFTLNTGHVSFFYDKGSYLERRYSHLRHELSVRKINFNVESELDPDRVFQSDLRLYGEWTITSEALHIIRTRIAEKVAMKPEWYRMSKRG